MKAPPRDDASFDRVARSVLDNLLEGCQVVGFDFRYLYLNEMASRHGGRAIDELLGKTMTECYPGIEETPMFAMLRRCMTDRVHDRMENEFTRPDGSVATFELRFLPVPEGLCILSLDITDERKAAARLQRTEEQLRHAQKMEAIGTFAGGIAHDFNNLLTVILSYADLALANLSPSDTLHEPVHEMMNAGKRAAELTSQLLTFSRHQLFEPKIIDLNEVLSSMDRMLQRILGSDIDLVSLTETPLERVQVDRGSIEQVIMNLVVNARDAMPTGGKLTMETRNVVLDEAFAREHLGVEPGPHVMLAVTDTGTGMDMPTRERIFEPFFTTKEQGKGTGLGLSTVFGIVQQSNGSIWVYSEPGKGTSFKIYFPRYHEPVASIASTPPPRPNQHGSETVLLVEDDDQVRAVARRILLRHGYQILEARNAGEAILLSSNHRGVIHLLLSDVVMPQMCGPELAKRLASVRPEMRLLCMSGYTDDSIVRHGVIEAHISYLQKPFTPESLARKVREVLDAPDEEP